MRNGNRWGLNSIRQKVVTGNGQSHDEQRSQAMSDADECWIRTQDYTAAHLRSRCVQSVRLQVFEGVSLESENNVS